MTAHNSEKDFSNKNSNTAIPEIAATAQHVLSAFEEPISTLKLQKLCYLAQGYTLAWTNGIPLFGEDFQAWKTGPVCPELWNIHKNLYTVAVSDIPHPDIPLMDWEQDAIDAVMKSYKYMTSIQLKDFVADHEPWLEARKNISEDAPCHDTMSKESMMKYFMKL